MNWNKCRLIQSCASRQSLKSGISFVALRVWFLLWYASLAGGPRAGSCVFPNHIQSTELTTNGLQLKMSQGWLRERAKDLNTYANAIIKSLNLQVCKHSLWHKCFSLISNFVALLSNVTQSENIAVCTLCVFAQIHIYATSPFLHENLSSSSSSPSLLSPLTSYLALSPSLPAHFSISHTSPPLH